MITVRKNKLIYFLIVLALFVALVPVILSNNYLRQDDIKTGIWWGMQMSDEGFQYYNAVFQMVRPLCMYLFFLSDLMSINMHYAVIMRFISIVNVCILAICLYHWQMQFNRNRILAATFPVASFTLPGIQLFAATANYYLIILGMLLAFAGPYFWYKSSLTQDENQKKKYLYIGCAIYFASFLDYPVSSMYAWVLLGICYLNSLTADTVIQDKYRKFFYYGSGLVLGTMVFYFIFMQIFHWVLHVHMGGRVGTSNLFTIASRLFWIKGVLVRDPYLWFFGLGNKVYPLLTIVSLVSLALLRLQPKKILQHLAILFFIFFMCYSPMLAGQDLIVTFRYTLATMPFLLYLIFWSLHVLTFTSQSSVLLNVPHRLIMGLLIATAIFGVGYANLMIADGIVGPQTNDYKYVQAELSKKVVPLIQQGKLVALYVRDCDEGRNYPYEKGVPVVMEYGMRHCALQYLLVGVVTHSLATFGYESNRHHENGVYSTGKIFVLKDVPWGNIVIMNNNQIDFSHLDYPLDKMTVVTMDMRKVPAYKHLDFYRNLLG